MATKEVNPITLLTTALREIRSLKSNIEDLQRQVAHLSAGNSRKVSITEYAQSNNLSPQCVRKHIFKGILNAEKIGGKYYIIIPA